MLYLIALPVGNPEDITLRALRHLRTVNTLFAEDVPTAQALMQHYDITTPITAYDLADLTPLWEVAEQGDAALIIRAGMPGVDHPTEAIVRGALARGVALTPLPGASAALVALVASGLPTDSFLYVGSLTDLEAYVDEALTLVFQVDDMRTALTRVGDVLGDRAVCVAGEISTPQERLLRGTVNELAGQVLPERGWLVVGAAAAEDTQWDEAKVRAALQKRLAAGESLSNAAKSIAAQAGWKKRDVYDLAK
ncbi:MAG: 16S rRNA (cytidine(1402)-2'-O)-methyltransferase [Anaerolineae bacterium]